MTLKIGFRMLVVHYQTTPKTNIYTAIASFLY